jgi:hypothetical protein
MTVSRTTGNQSRLLARCAGTMPIPGVNDILVDPAGLRHEVLCVSEKESTALIQSPDGEHDVQLATIAGWENIGPWEA